MNGTIAPDNAVRNGRRNRLLRWLGGGLAAVIGIPVTLGILLLLAGIPLNQYVGEEVRELCDSYRVGQPGAAADMLRLATQRGYTVKWVLDGADSSLDGVIARRVPWVGHVWECFVTFDGGTIRAVDVRDLGYR